MQQPYKIQKDVFGENYNYLQENNRSVVGTSDYGAPANKNILLGNREDYDIITSESDNSESDNSESDNSESDNSESDNSKSDNSESMKKEHKYKQKNFERQNIIFNTLDNSDDETSEEISEVTSNSEDFSDNNNITLENSVELLNLDNIKKNNALDYLYKDNNMSVSLFSKEVVEKIYYLIVTNNSKNPNETITINLDRIYKNVVSVKLTDAILKGMNGDSYGFEGTAGTLNKCALPFVSLYINEFNSSFESTNATIKNSFATLGNHIILDGGGTVLFRHYTDLGDTSPTKFFNPRISFNKLKIDFKNPLDHQSYNFVETYTSGEFFWLTFKIVCLERQLKTNYLNKTDG